MKKFKRFKENNIGKDFVVGDIHGSYTLLMNKLETENFDFQKDRLFFLGDLLNKGKENELCLSLLDEEWFKPVVGNHEIMFIQAFLYDDFTMIYDKGSDWFDHSHLSRKELKKWAQRIAEEVPFGMELTLKDSKIGFVHAEPLEDWKEVELILDRDWTFDEYFNSNSEDLIKLKKTIWSRKKFNGQDESLIKNINRVYVGHTPNEKVHTFGNVHYIDLGSYKSGLLHLEEIK